MITFSTKWYSMNFHCPLYNHIILRVDIACHAFGFKLRSTRDVTIIETIKTYFSYVQLKLEYVASVCSSGCVVYRAETTKMSIVETIEKACLSIHEIHMFWWLLNFHLIEYMSKLKKWASIWSWMRRSDKLLWITHLQFTPLNSTLKHFHTSTI